MTWRDHYFSDIVGANNYANNKSGRLKHDTGTSQLFEYCYRKPIKIYIGENGQCCLATGHYWQLPTRYCSLRVAARCIKYVMLVAFCKNEWLICLQSQRRVQRLCRRGHPIRKTLVLLNKPNVKTAYLEIVFIQIKCRNLIIVNSFY